LKEEKMRQFSNIDPAVAKSWLLVPGDWRRPAVADSYKLLWDSSRSYGQLWPRPSHSDVAAFYDLDAYYTHHTGKNASNQKIGLRQKVQTKLSWWSDKGVDACADWWKDVLGAKKLRILEVGCGNGANLSIFQALGHECVGVEPDAKALDVARSQGHEVYAGTAENLPDELADDRFDVVVFMHVLEHCIHPSLAVKNATNLLNPGGLFVAEVPNNESRGAKRFGELWYWLDVPRHLNFFTEASLGTLVTTSGMQIESFFFRGYCRQFGADWKNAQSHIADTFGVTDDHRVGGANYWRHLAETAWSGDRQKYDSVRVLAVLPQEPHR
jgi:2-polyprenyl-3-methyl-5-hydroxy-6-metoxy-1,4-benzoquinol methylase